MTTRRPTRLPRWHELAVYVGFGALLITGVAWLALDQWVRVAGEFGPEHHPAQNIVLIVHGVAAYAFLIVAGALIPVHVKLGWSIGRNWISGVTLASILGVLSVSALGLYYLSGDAARGWSSLAHWTIGLIALPALLIHVIRGRRGITLPRAGSPRRRGRPTPGG
jgi:hypothetical protein